MKPGKLYRVKATFNIYQIESADDHKRVNFGDNSIVRLLDNDTFVLTSTISNDWSLSLVMLHNGKLYITRFHTDFKKYDLSNYVQEI